MRRESGKQACKLCEILAVLDFFIGELSEESSAFLIKTALIPE